MFKFIKAMAGVAKDEAPSTDCGCGCGPKRAPVMAEAEQDEDCPCCGPKKSVVPNGVPSCGSCGASNKSACCEEETKCPN